MTHNKKRLGLSIPINLYENIRKKAEYQGKTINATCIDIFWEYFESREIKDMERDNARQQEGGIE